MTQTAMMGITGGPSAAAATTSPAERAALEKAAKGFEAIFVRQLLGSMRGASGGESIDGSSAVDQFQELSDARMAESLSDGGGLGIAQLILQQLDR